METPIASKPRAIGNTPASPTSQGQPPPPPWFARGVEDVYLQREAQVTWRTVLGGKAIGALLTQLPEVVSQVQAGR